MESQSFIEKYKITDRIIWICLVFFFWYLIVGDGFIGMPIEAFFKSLKVSDAMRFVFMYTQTICGWIAFLILCLFKKNRGDVLHDVLPKKKPNSFSKLLKGLLIGFLMNFACILCALIHGDIKLYFDFSPAGIPLMLFALFSVFIQSSCEEIWTRGFMYERINVHYSSTDPYSACFIRSMTALRHWPWQILSSAESASRCSSGTPAAYGLLSVFILRGTSHKI